MGKIRPSRPDAASKREFGERMVESIMEAALNRDQAVDRPDYCGECRYFRKPLRAVSYGRCHRNPPEVHEPLFDEEIDDDAGFDCLRPPVLPEDVGCGEGERRR